MIQKSFRLFVTALIVSTLAACSVLTETVTDVRFESGIDTSESKAIVFPLMLKGSNLKAANEGYDSAEYDAAVLSSWGKRIGTDNAVPLTKSMISAAPGGWKATELMLNNIGKAEDKIGKNSSGVANFVKAVSEAAGDGALALTIINEDKAAYEASQTINMAMGFFDTKSFQFKWVSKITQTQKAPIPYGLAVTQALNTTWEALEEKSAGEVR